MLTAYVFCLAVGAAFLGLSLFGDFFDSEVDFDAEVDVDIDAHGADVAKLLSLRTVVYALFGFGAAGAALHSLWDGTRPGVTAVVAGATGLVSGALISTVFGFLKRTDSGAKPVEQSFIGLTGRVALDLDSDALGEVSVQRGERRYRIRARIADASDGAGALAAGSPIVVVDMADGVASVAPVDVKLLEDETGE